MSTALLQSAAWRLRPADGAQVARLARAANLPEIVARLLVQRGQVEPAAASRHLDAPLSSLHDPSLLPGLEEAGERLARAVRDRETILVHGDYDVDGVCG